MQRISADYFNSEEGKTFWGKQGAGILCVALDTGRFLLVHRSSQVEEPGTWGLPGGAVEEDQGIEQAAKTELFEETGYRGPIRLVKSYVYKSGGFEFHNFIGFVAKEFKPRLDWENQGSGWFSFDNLPSPLHFGVKALFERGDMKKLKVIKLARWVGEKKVPFSVGRLTQRGLDTTSALLEVSEYVFQKAMDRCAQEMGGSHYDGIITIPNPYGKKPLELCVHYLKYMERDGDYVAWMVYPKDTKNRSPLFKMFESPIQGSFQTWKEFLRWMARIVRIVNKQKGLAAA